MLGIFKGNKMFRRLLGYQIFSGLGGGVFSLFMLLSIHLLYDNPVYTGLAGFLIAAPHIIAFAIGPVIDRRDKVGIMRITTFLEFTVLALLSFTPLLDVFGIVFLLAVVTVFSFSALFEGAAGTAYLPQIIEGDKIMEANSLIQIASFAGGIFVAVGLFAALGDATNDFGFIYGISTGFLLCAFIFSLTLKDPATATKPPIKQLFMQDLQEGGKFIRQSVLLFIIVATVAKSFAIDMANVNRPAFIEYHAGARGYIVFAVMGLVGGILASALVGTFGSKFKIGWLIFVLFIFAGIVRVAFVFILPLSYFAGLGTMIAYATLGTALGTVKSTLSQNIPPKDMVGRVDTIQTTFVAVFSTLGALAGGFLGYIVPDAGYVIIYHGLAYIGIGLLIIVVPSVRKLPKMNEIQKPCEKTG